MLININFIKIFIRNLSEPFLKYFKNLALYNIKLKYQRCNTKRIYLNQSQSFKKKFKKVLNTISEKDILLPKRKLK